MLVLVPFSALPLVIAAADFERVRWLFWPLAALTLYLTVAVVLEPPTSVSGVPGFDGVYYPQLLWPPIVDIWRRSSRAPRHTSIPTPRRSSSGAEDCSRVRGVLLRASAHAPAVDAAPGPRAAVKLAGGPARALVDRVRPAPAASGAAPLVGCQEGAHGASCSAAVSSVASPSTSRVTSKGSTKREWPKRLQ